MKINQSKLSVSLALVSLMGGTALVAVSTPSRAATDLQANTSWAISRVASAAQGSYCTMAQKFGNGTVFTIANNAKGEYSLAFDFQSPKFKAGEPMAVSLKAGSGATQSFEVSPQTAEAFVIGLGTDKSLIDDAKKNGKIQLDVAGESYAFNTAKFSEAQTELATCMSSMKPQLREAKVDETKSPDAASLEAAEKNNKGKVADAKPAAKSAGKSSGALNADDLIAAPINSEVPARELAKITPAAEEDDLRNENARLKQALGDARRSYENQISSQAGPAVPELQEKITALEIENANLKEDRANSKANQKSNVDSAKMAADFDKALKDLAAATEQNKALQEQVATAQQTQRDLQTLKSENQTLKNQAQIAASGNAPESLTQQQAKAQADAQAAGKEIIALRTENEKLAKELVVAQRKAQPPTVVPVDLQIQLSQLQNENKALKAQLEGGDAAGMPSMATAGKSAGEGSVRDQMRDLKGQLEIIESENKGLKQQLANLQTETEGGQLKVAGGNWDLQQATRRYQESQREIRRLGALLEQDRVKCQQEKKDIEYMLFDPEVAKPAQITMLNSLEDQVAQKDVKIAELEGKVNGTPDQLNALKAAEARATEAAATVATLQGQVGQCDARVASLQSDVNKKGADNGQAIAALQADIKARDARIASLEETSRKANEASATVTALQTEMKGRDNRIAILEEINKKSSDTGATVAMLQNELKARDQRISALQADVLRVQGVAATVGSKDARIAQLESVAASVATKDARIAQLEGVAASMGTKDARIAELENVAKRSVDTSTATVATLQTQLREKDAKIATLETEVQKVASQSSTLTTQSAALAALQSQVKAKDDRIAALEAEGLKSVNQAATVAIKDAKISELEYALKLAQMQPAAGTPAAVIPAVAPHQPQAPIPASIQPMNAQAAPVVAPQTLVQSSPLRPADLAPVQQVAALPVPVQSAPVGKPTPAAYAAQPPAAVAAQDTRFQNQQQLSSMLQKAGVGLRGQVQAVKSANSDTYKAFSWQTDSLYGSSEQRVMASRGGFEPAVQQYIDRAKSRCSGDFAAVPAQISAPSGGSAEGYEIACVTGQSGSSASVLFTYSDGIMTTVAHEGRAEAMDIAMDARDKVAAKFSSN